MAAAVILIPEMLSGPDRESSEQPAAAEEGAIKTYTIDLSQSPGATTTATSPEAVDNRVPPPEETPPSTAQLAAQRAPEPETRPDPTPAPVTEFPAGSPAPRTEAPVAAEISPSRVEQRAELASRAEPRAETPPRQYPEAQTPPRQIAAQPARAEALPQSQARSEPARAEAKPQAKPEVQPRPVASPPVAPTSSVPAGKGWAVQLGSYSSAATAERLMNEWRAKGQNAFVMPVSSGGKTLYRVRIGPTKDRASAETALQSVKASIPGAAVVAHP